MTKLITAIRTPKLWNSQDGVRGVYQQAYKYLQEQRFNLNSVINRELGRQTEERLLSSELLGKYGVF